MRPRCRRPEALPVVLALLLCACTAPAPGQALPAGGVDYQLGGASQVPDGVTVVARDVTEAPAPGAYGICYLNGFQTQPGSLAEWESQAPQALLRRDGEPVADPDWPDEHVLDSRTPEARDAVVGMITPLIQDCAEQGYDAVELDNLDAYTRFPELTAQGTLDLAEALIDAGHAQGLAVAQKNAAELGERGRQIGYDFAVLEECLAQEECAAFAQVWGAEAVDVEYTDQLSAQEFTVRCAEAPNPDLTILRDRDLAPAGAPGHSYLACASR